MDRCRWAQHFLYSSKMNPFMLHIYNINITVYKMIHKDICISKTEINIHTLLCCRYIHIVSMYIQNVATEMFAVDCSGFLPIWYTDTHFWGGVLTRMLSLKVKVTYKIISTYLISPVCNVTCFYSVTFITLFSIKLLRAKITYKSRTMTK